MASAKAPDPPISPAPAGKLLGPLFQAPAQPAPYATRAADSRGRLYPESESATRTCYGRDRDRIIHSTAFRRLKHKTQVFVEHEGDYYRTRLTHSLEVAQLARALARTLACDEDLAEAVALAHDMGHTPFGHSGEEALSAATADIGGFDHNAHALRLVTKLEHRYADFDGLNLTWETLEGLVKHNGPLISDPLRFQLSGGAQTLAASAETTSPLDALRAKGEAGLSAPIKPLPAPISSFDARWPLDLARWPGLEAQLAALADDIAYVNHDLDDGLRAGIFSVADLGDAPLAGGHAGAVLARYGELELSRFIGEMTRSLMSALLDDVRGQTAARLAAAAPQSAADIRNIPHAVAGFSPPMLAQMLALKKFLFQRMYRHPRVMGPMNRAKAVIRDLFAALSARPELLPDDWAAGCGMAGDPATGRVVRDYIAGMTDTFALAEYRRIFGAEINLKDDGPDT